MTKVQIKNKVQDYLDNADERILKMVYALLKEYKDTSKTDSLLTATQQAEIEKRWEHYKNGKSKSYTIAEVKQHVKSRLAK